MTHNGKRLVASQVCLEEREVELVTWDTELTEKAKSLESQAESVLYPNALLKLEPSGTSLAISTLHWDLMVSARARPVGPQLQYRTAFLCLMLREENSSCWGQQLRSGLQLRDANWVVKSPSTS